MADTDDPLAFSPTSPIATTVDVRPPPTNDRYQERMDAAFDKQEKLIGRAEESMGREEQIRAEQSKALAPLRQRIMDVATQPLPERPQLQQPPKVPQQSNQQDQETWLFASALLGSLAGAFTRRHQTNALAAFAGAMEGYNEGSRQKYDQGMKTWEAENKRTLETNQQAMDHYRGILEDRKLSLDQMTVALQMAAAQYDDNAMAAAAKSKNSLVIAQLYDKQAEALGRMRTSSESISLRYAQLQQKERIELAKQQLRATGINDPAKMAAMIDAIGTYRAPPIQGRAGTAVMELVMEKYPDYDQGKWFAKRLSSQTDARAEQRTVIEFDVGMSGRQVQSLNVAIAHLGTLEELGKAIGNSDFPLVNELANRVSYELGYPMPSSFDAAKQIVTAEIVKAVVNNGGGVTERQEAEKRMSNANSWAQMNDVIRTYKSLLAGQMKGLKKRYESGSRRDDFDSKLEPETIEALKTAGVSPEPSRTPPGYRKIGDETSAIEQLGITFPSYKSGEPYSQPAEGIQRGQQGVGVNWLPKGWRMEPFWQQKPEGWKVEQVQ